MAALFLHHLWVGQPGVGGEAIVRFARFVAYQNIPDRILPDTLKNGNPLGLMRKINGKMTTETIQ